MDLRLDGKRALVTGSTAGIGFAIAKGLAQEGAAVIVNSRTAGRVTEAVETLNAETGARRPAPLPTSAARTAPPSSWKRPGTSTFS
jgi:NAD(P)-dependent dehydrogenase (short-subunit alcohol dehydrogenase family)